MHPGLGHRHGRKSTQCRHSLAGVRRVRPRPGPLLASHSLGPEVHQPSWTDRAAPPQGAAGTRKECPSGQLGAPRFPLRLRISRAASLEPLARAAQGGRADGGRRAE